MKEKALHFLGQLFAKDETCVSTLFFCTICFLILSVFMVFRDGDIPSNLYNLDIWLCAFIAAQTVATDKRTESFDIYNKK